MKHLLIGGAGFLGRNLAQELLDRGDSVAIYDNYSFSSIMDLSHPNLKLMLGDATNETSLTSALMAFRPDTVVWLAYLFAYDPNNVPYIRHSWLMHGLVRTLPSLATLNTGKFIFVSSDLVYKSKEGKLTESSALQWGNPTPYIFDKLIAETYVSSICKNLKIPWIILRPSIIVGKRNFLHPMADPLTFIIHTLLTNQPLMIKHGQQIRDYILVTQAIEMIANLINEKKSHGVFNVSSGRGIRNGELIQNLVEIIRPSLIPKVLESKEANLLLDNRKIQDFGLVKLTDISHELQSIVEHRRASLEATT